MAWQDAAPVDALALANPWLALTVGGVDIVIASVEGAWNAVEDRCTHAGCAFSEDAQLEGPDIVCGCHGSEFDMRTGDVRRGPAQRPIRTFPVRIAGSRVEVDL